MAKQIQLSNVMKAQGAGSTLASALDVVTKEVEKKALMFLEFLIALTVQITSCRHLLLLQRRIMT